MKSTPRTINKNCSASINYNERKKTNKTKKKRILKFFKEQKQKKTKRKKMKKQIKNQKEKQVNEKKNAHAQACT